MTNQGAQRVWHQQTHKANQAGNGHARTHRQRGARDHQRPQAGEIRAQTGGNVFAQRQGIQRRRSPPQQRHTRERKGDRQRGVGQAAVGQGAHQPEHDLVGRVGVVDQTQHQRAGGAGQTAQRNPGENQAETAGPPMGKPQQAERAQERAGQTA